jgi:hypothetical protein
MAANIHEADAASVLRTAIDDVGANPLVVAPTRGVVDAAAAVATREDAPTARLLAAAEPFQTARRDFFCATRLADLAAGPDGIRTGQSVGDAVVVGDDRAFALVSCGDCAGAVSAVGSDADRLRDGYETAFADGDTVSLRTPGRQALLERATEELGEAVAADLRAATAAADDGVGGDLTDGVSLLVLVGAVHSRQLYRLGSWAEDADLASKATVSRAKQRLEKAGLIETEKVPADVGRPRQRLHAVEESYADGEALYTAVADIDD